MAAIVLRSANRATEPKVRDLVSTDLVRVIARTRQERSMLTNQWLRYWNIWYARHDQQAYRGNLSVYLAIGRRVIETWVTKLKNDAFPPSGKWFQVEAEDLESEDKVVVITSLFNKYLRYMGVRRKFTPLMRTLLVTGNAPVDVGWKQQIREMPAIMEVLNDSGTGKRMEETIARVVQYLGPTARPVDPCRMFVYPTTVNDISEIGRAHV